MLFVGKLGSTPHAYGLKYSADDYSINSVRLGSEPQDTVSGLSICAGSLVLDLGIENPGSDDWTAASAEGTNWVYFGEQHRHDHSIIMVAESLLCSLRQHSLVGLWMLIEQ